MTDETQVSDQEQTEDKGLPTPTFSKPSDDKPTSTPDLDAIAELVAAKLSPTIEKTVQSVKDRRFSEFDKMKKALGLDDLAALEALGATIPDEAKLEVRLRALEQRGAVPEQPSGKVEVKAEDWSKVIEDVGLDTRNPEAINFLRGNFRDMEDFELQASRLARKLNSQTRVPLEQKASISGSSGAPTDYDKMTDDQLGDRVEHLAKTDFVGSTEERAKINAELDRRANK